MAVGTADLTDAASRSSGRSTVRGARSADAGTAHAGFDRNLTAVTQAIDAARPPAGGVAPSGDAAAAALSEAGDAKRALTFAGRDAATTSGTPGALAKGTGGPTQVTARARSFTPAAMQASLTGTGRWLDLRSTPGGATKSEGTAASASADATKVDDASATKADREPVTKGLGEAAPTASTASVPAVAAPASQGPIAADAAPGPIRSGSLSPTRSVDTVRAKPGARFQSTDGSAETTGETTTRADGSAEATPDVGRIADPAETSDPKADPASATPDFDEGAPATSLANILGVAAPAPQGPVAAGAVPDLIPSESTVPMPSVDAARARPNARVQAVAGQAGPVVGIATGAGGTAGTVPDVDRSADTSDPVRPDRADLTAPSPITLDVAPFVPSAAAGDGTGPAGAAGKPPTPAVAAVRTEPGVPVRSIAGRLGARAETATDIDATADTAKNSDDPTAPIDAVPAPPPPDAAAKPTLPASGTSGASAVPERAAAQAYAAVPLGQVPMTIGLRSLAGSSRFEIRLDPAELGRIDVRLDIDKERGSVTTHLVVERIDTLAMLQRDAGSLQQALSQAGLDPSEGGINLSLRGDGGAGGQGGQRDAPPDRGIALPSLAAGDPAAEAGSLHLLRGLGGLDIWI